MGRERVAFADTDASGLIHFASLLRFFEIGEREAMRELGYLRPPYTAAAERGKDGRDIIFPRVHVSCDYRSAVRADDPVTILTKVGRVGRTSITWEIALRSEDSLVAEGTMVTVCVDRASGEPVPLASDLRQALERSRDGAEAG